MTISPPGKLGEPLRDEYYCLWVTAVRSYVEKGGEKTLKIRIEMVVLVCEMILKEK